MPSPDSASEPLRKKGSQAGSPLDGTVALRYTSTAYNGARTGYSGLPDAQPFPSPGLSFSRSRSTSPTDTRRGSYFGRVRGGSYASLTGGDAFAEGIPRASGDARSFRTFGTEFTTSPHDMNTRLLAEKRSRETAEWKVHWTTPVLMVGLWFAGFIAAIAHHAFYLSLNGKPATNQLLMFRIGTAFAFFVRAMFVGSVVFSYRQRIWETFRNKALTLGAIDSLFAATEDPLGFANFEMWRNAKVAVFMAIAVWLIPLASVLSPSALITGIRPSVYDTTCPIVSTLNFTQESVYDFRKKTLYPGYSLAFYNTTDVNATKPGWFDYYDQPSKNARRLTTTSAYLRRPVVSEDAANAACGGGWNCTYDITFTGPGYKCDEIANSSSPNDSQLQQIGSPLNISSMAPISNIIYSANVDAGDYADPQAPTDQHGQPLDPNAPDLGVFKTEPVLWIGYSIQTGQPWPAGSTYASDARWSAGVIESKILRCVHYEVAYDIKINFTEGVQTTEILQRHYLAPVVNTTLTPNAEGVVDGVPEANWVRPDTDAQKYKLTAAYHALGTMLRAFLRGSIESEGYVQTRSDLSETRLTDGSTAYPVADLDTQLQSFYEDMLLSLLSEPKLVVAANASVPCVKTKSMIVHIYQARGLWIGYSIVTFIALAALVVGSLSLYRNGVSSDTLFSRIMVTTRNPTLDSLSVGACLGSDPFPKDLTMTKLRFGVLASSAPFDELSLQDKVEHVGFGTIDEVTALRKGGKYA